MSETKPAPEWAGELAEEVIAVAKNRSEEPLRERVARLLSERFQPLVDALACADACGVLCVGCQKIVASALAGLKEGK